MLDGNDTSNWQDRTNVVDWRGVLQHLGFDIAKATEGSTFVDARYAEVRDAARSVGTLFGAYHYAGAGNPIVEAAHFCRTAGRREGELQALDFEGNVLAVTDPVGWAAAWLAEVDRRTGNTPLIYMSEATLTEHDWTRVRRLGVGLWLAAWRPVAQVPGAEEWPFWAVWQHTDSASAAGLPGLVDADLFNGDRAAWLAYGHNRAASPAPATPEPPVLVKPHAPAPAPVPHAPAPKGSYRVQPGDTLDGIAAAHHTTREALVESNAVRYPGLQENPHHIEAGWLLVFPGAASTHPVYKVQSGDTLSGIAAAHHCTVDQLLALNAPLRANANLIYPGQRVFLP